MPHDDPPTFVAAVLIAIAIWWWRQRNRARSKLLAAPADPMTPIGFERHCAALMREQGWRATLTAGSGDQGVDVLAKRRGVSVVIQCKLYSKPVGNAAVQEALAGKQFMGATHAAVVSNQPYTRSAIDLAGRTKVFLLSDNDLRRANDLFR